VPCFNDKSAHLSSRTTTALSPLFAPSLFHLPAATRTHAYRLPWQAVQRARFTGGKTGDTFGGGNNVNGSSNRRASWSLHNWSDFLQGKCPLLVDILLPYFRFCHCTGYDHTVGKVVEAVYCQNLFVSFVTPGRVGYHFSPRLFCSQNTVQFDDTAWSV
jgi:hypothetical protein